MSERMSEELEQEYDEVFDGEEKVTNMLKLTSEAFSREKKTIPIKGIAITQPLKMGRKDTMHGLTATVKDLGVVTPIHVMTVDSEEEDEDYKYILLDGVRRLYGALKNGNTEIDAVVWDFEDKERAMELGLVLSLILNRTQKRTWNEVWNLYKILEMQDNFTPGTLEYLLQLEGGDAMKLKDVMLCDYDEVKQALLNNEKGLEACYKMLQKLRKEEDVLLRDDVTGVSDIVEDDDISGNNEEAQLSDDDVRELLEMADDLDSLDDVGEDDFEELNKADAAFVEQQVVGERHPLDPAIRQAVLARDDFTCACCGMRMVGVRLGLIAVHHKIPVHVGEGGDTLPNLVTLCIGCHLSLHIMERQGGSILMSQSDFEGLPESDQIAIKKARKLALIAIDADKRKGLSKEQVKEATKSSIQHPMPGSGLKENQIAYASVNKEE